MLDYETMEETKQGVKRDSLPIPWDEVALHLIKYISYGGRYNLIYSYHSKFLYQLRYYSHQNPEEKLSVPHLFLQSLREMSAKVQEGKTPDLSHHGLVKLLVCDALNRQQC
jgi:hypothetical protein